MAVFVRNRNELEFLMESNDMVPTIRNGCVGMIVSVSIQKKPVPLRRGVATLTKSGKVRIANPHAREIVTFRNDIIQQLPGYSFPVFNTDVPLSITMVFGIRRPNFHFVNSMRTNKLKNEFVGRRVTGGDLDNYVKFVLDALNGIMYLDDKCVCRMCVEKRWENDETNEGSTTIAVSIIQ